MMKMLQKEKLIQVLVELEATIAKGKVVKEGEDRDKVAEEDQVDRPEEALHLDPAHLGPDLDQGVVPLEQLVGIRVHQAQEDLPHQALPQIEEILQEAQEEAHQEAQEDPQLETQEVVLLGELVVIKVHPAQEDLPHHLEELHLTEEVHQEVQGVAHLEALEVDLQGVLEEAHLEVREDLLTQEAGVVLQVLKLATLLQQDQGDLKVDLLEEAVKETMKVGKDPLEVQTALVIMMVLVLLLLIQDMEHLEVVVKDSQEPEVFLLLVNTLEMPVNLTWKLQELNKKKPTQMFELESQKEMNRI